MHCTQNIRKGVVNQKFFESVLGYNQFNVSDLISKVKEGMDINTIKMLSSDSFGQRIAIDMPITGQDG